MSAPGGGVSAEVLLRTLVRLQTRLPGEIGTFLILEACEQALSSGPCQASLAHIRISEDGAVTLAGAPPAREPDCARALHRDLTSLLVAGGPAPTPALMRLVEEGPRGGVWSLHQLRDDLEASLVPLNRNASRRVLARLVREVQADPRAEERPSATPTFQELDSELSSLLGGEPAPGESEDQASSPMSEEASLAARRAERERDATIREPVEEIGDASGDLLFDERRTSLRPTPTPTRDARTTVDPVPLPAPRMSPMSAAPPPRKPGAPAKVRAPRPSLPQSLPPGASMRPGQSKGVWLGVTLIALTVALGAATFVMRPEVVDRLLGRAPIAAPVEPEEKPAQVAPKAGDLVVHVAPERAQVLRFLGRGPVHVPHVPLGVAHEFVATMEGYAPTRLVLPPDAEWERTPDGARLEVAMQLGPKAAPEAALELGPSQMPQQLGSPQSTRGTVRIVTTPRGAKVYQLVGFAPEARIENLPLDEAQELLVIHKGYQPQIKVVAPSDFVAETGSRPVAEVRITLAPRGKSAH